MAAPLHMRVTEQNHHKCMIFKTQTEQNDAVCFVKVKLGL